MAPLICGLGCKYYQWHVSSSFVRLFPFAFFFFGIVVENEASLTFYFFHA